MDERTRRAIAQQVADSNARRMRERNAKRSDRRWWLLVLAFVLVIPFWIGYLFYSAPTCAPDEWPVYSGMSRICVRGHQ